MLGDAGINTRGGGGRERAKEGRERGGREKVMDIVSRLQSTLSDFQAFQVASICICSRSCTTPLMAAHVLSGRVRTDGNKHRQPAHVAVEVGRF
jgi:hypothetical protein